MKELNLNDYVYDLPAERIASHPLAERDQSKLLFYNKGVTRHGIFKNIATSLPEHSLLVFNNTKVISARLKFTKETGAEIEIFLLAPVRPSAIIADVMTSTSSCSWECTIGNLKKWNDGLVLRKHIENGELTASLVDRKTGLVNFTWNTGSSFAEIVDETGATPLPPYIKRSVEPEDRERYQTIYSRNEGAVAAPTAGLHFTEKVFEDIRKRNIDHDYITLHVSAGTFQPIKTERINEHVMHKEQVVITTDNVKKLLDKNFVIPVGTTSMRTIESVYWYGVRILERKDKTFHVTQDDPYLLPGHITKHEALGAVLQQMADIGKDTIVGETSIFIKPGYNFKISNALITNFHQPGSTLILLVAAFIGEDWRKIYEEALSNNYRFLSYGDSSLLIP
jgi:S-adenosylmethionine:tRNA ribosyltransferase-isomerase